MCSRPEDRTETLRKDGMQRWASYPWLNLSLVCCMIGKRIVQKKWRTFMSLYEELCNVLGSEQVLCDEAMSRHTTFRIGGPADYFVIPRSIAAVSYTHL